MSVVQSIMDFIRGREQEAPVDVPVSLPQTAPQAPNTPPIRESYMPDNSNSAYVNKAYMDQIKSRSLKKRLEEADSNEDNKQRQAYEKEYGPKYSKGPVESVVTALSNGMGLNKMGEDKAEFEKRAAARNAAREAALKAASLAEDNPRKKSAEELAYEAEQKKKLKTVKRP